MSSPAVRMSFHQCSPWLSKAIPPSAAGRPGSPSKARPSASMSKVHRGTLRLSSNAFLELTRGPESAAEVSAWDDIIVSKMADANLASPALSNLAHGAIGCTDYSGTDFFREPLRIIAPALAARLDAATPHVRCVRSCDWGTMQLYVLKKQSQLLDN